MKTIALRDKIVAGKLTDSWDATRPRTSPCKDAKANIDAVREDSGDDQLVLRMLKAAEYSAALAERPEEFMKIAKSCREKRP